MTTPDELRKQAKKLEKQAHELERKEIKKHEKFIVVENIQDERLPNASGPFTWDEAISVVENFPNRYICRYGMLLP